MSTQHTPAAISELIKVATAAATLMAAPVNHFGKPEFYSAEEMAAREVIRSRAVSYKISMADHGTTVLHQTAAVVRAAIAKAEGAAFIVRACNAHDELLAALREIEALEGTERDEWDAVELVMPEMARIARAAIAKAEGQS